MAFRTVSQETCLLSASASAVITRSTPANGKAAFHPHTPSSFEDAGLNAAIVEALVLKFLVNSGMASGRRIAAELGLPFRPFPEFLRQLKNQQYLTYADSSSANDYVYSLTDAGRARARLQFAECAYVGPAPVPFGDYLRSVSEQSVTNEHPREADLRKAFADLLVPEETFRLLGPAINSWPRAVSVRLPRQRQDQHRRADRALFRHDGLDSAGDPGRGTVPQAAGHGQPRAGRGRALQRAARRVGLRPPLDPDRRPTIVAGGELRMDDLEIHFDPVTKVSEAPLQLKSNLGTFLIDDFGRQRMQPVELLNRWIVPLEKRYDFLSLANGKKIRVPFDQLIIFSTNLEPSPARGRGLPAPHSLQDRGGQPHRGRLSQNDRIRRRQAGLQQR